MSSEAHNGSARRSLSQHGKTLLERIAGSFLAKLGTLIGVLSLVPLVLTSAAIFQLTSTALRDGAKDKLRLMRDAAVLQTEFYLAEGSQDVQIWSSEIVQQRSASALSNRQTFARWLKLNPEFRLLAIVAPDGTVVTSAGGYPHYPLPVFATRRPAISAVIWAREGPQVAFQYPIAGSRNALVAVLDLGPLRDIYQQTRIGETGETYLLGSKGHIIVGSRFVAVSPQFPVISTQGRKAALAGEQGVAEYKDYRGVPVIGAYAPLRLPGGLLGASSWVILSEQDVAEALAPAQSLATLMVIVTLLMALLTVTAIIFATRRISQPLRALDQAAEAIAAGRLDSRVRADARDEFGRVAETFNHMACRLQEQVLSLQLMTTRLQELDRFKNDYIHAISHDLRTPLTVIDGYTELLQDNLGDQADSPLCDYLGHIARATMRLQQMVEDLLDAARLEAGTFHLDLETFDLGARLKSLVESLQLSARDAGVRLLAEVPDTPLEVRADCDRIDRVVANLVGNAIKFTPAGGEIRVKAGPSDGGVRCEITDTGEGIAPENIPLLFRRFSQLESGQKKKSSTGLGLSICKAIVEAHGGEIAVRSIPGQGSSFWFTLPPDPGA